MPLAVISQRCQIAYDEGWVKPCFLETSKKDLKLHRPIREPEHFIYYRKTMDTAEEAAMEDKLVKQMYDNCKKLLESDMDLSPSFSAVLESAMNGISGQVNK